MVLTKPVLETVLPITDRTPHAHIGERIDISLAARMRALRRRKQGRFPRACAPRSLFPASSGPGAGSRAFVRGFGAMV